jgi:hypothetical protein
MALVLTACGGGVQLDPLAEAAALRAAQAATQSVDQSVELPESLASTSSTLATVEDQPSTPTSSTTTPLTTSTVADPSDSSAFCRSASVGYEVNLPDGWSCDTVTTPVTGGTAFSLAAPEGTLTITVGTGEATFACELFDACGQEPIELSSQFDTSIFAAGGITEITGPHIDGEIYVIVVSNSEIATADESIITAVLDSARPLG